MANRIREKMKNSLIFTFPLINFVEGILTLNDIFPSEIKGNWSIDKVSARGVSKAGCRCTVVASEVV
ncbi:hypothetical protein [Marinomonas rhizomae]|uniref:hypothetical protein n=1 Tax=Marinomonas rhizomae TaxID=491948 RepID=UPI001F4DFEA3|nr:hypothetical protein [Marinomonas rhizomae]